MAPSAENGVQAGLKAGDYQVVAWDLNTTGRRLIDEICQVSGYYEKSKADDDKQEFNQYVMPHKNPNPGARRSFGIKVKSMGRYRMLKDVETGKVLKTKSEISALQEFINWLKEAKGESKTGVILVSHEPARNVLVPMLLESLRKYNLMDSFSEVVSGFGNSVTVVEKFANKEEMKVTSNSLRSLCKTVLNNTNPSTNSALDRSKILVEILAKVCEDDLERKVQDCATSFQHEVDEANQLRTMLGTQGTLRPIFEGQLRQRRATRERALALRKIVAEAGLNYDSLLELYKPEPEPDSQAVKDGLKKKVGEDTNDTDIDELVKLMDRHFIKSLREEEEAKAKEMSPRKGFRGRAKKQFNKNAKPAKETSDKEGGAKNEETVAPTNDDHVNELKLETETV